jgi:hypothetical protein
MALLENLFDNRRGDGLSEILYTDFSGGLNDTATPIAMSENEVAVAQNVDFSADVKAFSTRRGCTKYTLTGGQLDGREVTDGYAWTVVNKHKKFVVAGGVLYDVTDAVNIRAVYDIKSDRIYPFTYDDRLYFTCADYDGAGHFYVYGDFDYTVEIYDGENISQGQTVRYYTPKPPKSGAGDGDTGHYYKALSDVGVVTNIYDVNFKDAAVWQDITDVPNSVSSSFREVPDISTGAKEVYKVSIVARNNPSANVQRFGVCLDNRWYYTKTPLKATNGTNPTTVEGVTAAIAADLSALINDVSNGDGHTSGKPYWNVSFAGNTITFTATEIGVKADAFIDYDHDTLDVFADTTVQGAPNNNDIVPIRKCTMLYFHKGSMRVFAAGNPDDNALYWSEIGSPTKWNTGINKLYPINEHTKVTGITEISSALLVSYENSWYSWTGVDPGDDATWKQLNIPYGCACHESIALTPYSFTYLSKDGIYTVSASILSQPLVMLQSKGMITKITENRAEKLIGSIVDRKICRGIFYDNTYYLAYNALPSTISDANQTGFYSVEGKAKIGGRMFYRNAVGDRWTCESVVYTPPSVEYFALEAVQAWLIGHGMKSVHDGLTLPEYIALHTDNDFVQEIQGAYEGGQITTGEGIGSNGNNMVLKYEWDTKSFTTVTGWHVTGWLADPVRLYFTTMGYVLRANDGYADIDTATGAKKEIEVIVKTKAYTLGSPFVNKQLCLAGFIFRQDLSEIITEVDVMIEAGYQKYHIERFDLPESLIYGRRWGKRWGYREQQVKVVETNLSSDIFAVSIKQKCLDSPITMICIGFAFRATGHMLPQDVEMLKDEALYIGEPRVITR